MPCQDVRACAYQTHRHTQSSTQRAASLCSMYTFPLSLLPKVSPFRRTRKTRDIHPERHRPSRLPRHRTLRYSIQRRRMQRGPGLHLPTSLLPPLQRFSNPPPDLLIHEFPTLRPHITNNRRRRRHLVLFLLDNRCRLPQRRQPRVQQQHGVCGPELGDFVQTAGDEVAGRFGEGRRGEVGGFAFDDGLCTCKESVTGRFRERGRKKETEMVAPSLHGRDGNISLSRFQGVRRVGGRGGKRLLTDNCEKIFSYVSGG